MTCPKCGKTVGDGDAVCSNCGIALTEIKNKNKKDAKEIPLLETSKLTPKDKISNLVKGRNFKIILIVVAIVIFAFIVALIAVNIGMSKGEKIAKKTAEYIGSSVDEARTKLDIAFKDKSAYQGVTNSVKYSSVYESSGSVKAGGVNYPKWAVLLNEEDGKITSVKYADFRVVKDDLYGEERKTIVNLDKFEKGVSKKTINDEIDLDFYSVTYTKDKTTYVYKYWYTTENDDHQPVLLTVDFDDDDKFISFTSKLLYPENM